MTEVKFWIIIFTCLLLSACGGGGGDNSPAKLQNVLDDFDVQFSQPVSNTSNRFTTTSSVIDISGSINIPLLRSTLPTCNEGNTWSNKKLLNLTWQNKRSSEQGKSEVYGHCYFANTFLGSTYIIEAYWVINGVLLEIGVNEIEIITSEGDENVGKDSIFIERK